MNSSKKVAMLTVEMLDLWQAGSGRGEGQHLDSVPVTDADGLPFLPGRTVKGLLRDAVFHLERIDALGSWTDATGFGPTVALFGSRDGGEDESGSLVQTRYNSISGSVWVSDARLAPAIRLQIASTSALRNALFHESFATAIDDCSGQAKEQTLRSKRVCVPMVLTASIETSHPTGLEIIDAALPLIDALGSQRTRGLGRCIWSLKFLEISQSARSAA